MSGILWCDNGSHAFSDNDPDREQYTSNAPIKEGERRTRIDICGPCKEEAANEQRVLSREGMASRSKPVSALPASEAYTEMEVFGSTAAAMNVAPGTTVRIPVSAKEWETPKPV